MSSLPPGAPPPPPPPGPPYGMPGTGPIPWEVRQTYGFMPALVETAKLFITVPQDAFRRTREKGDFVEPLLFAVILSWVGIIVNQVYSMVFGTAMWGMLAKFLPEEAQRSLAPMMVQNIAGVIFGIVLGPIFVAIGLFIGSAIIHLCLMLVGGMSQSTAGFEGTFRALSYSSVADLAQIIPFVGGLIAMVWKIVLMTIGLATLHKTSTGKAVAAVLLPIAVCCVCLIAFGVAFAALIAGALGNR